LETPNLFKFYCFYAFGFGIFLASLPVLGFHFLPRAIGNRVKSMMFMSLATATISDVILFFLTAIKIIELTRTGSLAKNSRFQQEKERFELKTF
jgi:hypothetical protein